MTHTQQLTGRPVHHVVDNLYNLSWKLDTYNGHIVPRVHIVPFILVSIQEFVHVEVPARRRAVVIVRVRRRRRRRFGVVRVIPLIPHRTVQPTKNR